MRKAVILPAVAAITAILQGVSAVRAQEPQLFRSTEHRFRIKFPSAWEIKPGDGPNVVVKATRAGATILVLVRDLITPETLAEYRREDTRRRRFSQAQLRVAIERELDTRNFSKADLDALMQEQAATMLERFPAAKIEEQGVKYLDNKPAIYTRTLLPYTNLDLTVFVRSMSFQMFYKGKLYQVDGAAPAYRWDATFPAIFTSISTFVIEDW